MAYVVIPPMLSVAAPETFLWGELRGQKSKKLPNMADFCHFFLLIGRQVGGRASDWGTNAPHAPLMLPLNVVKSKQYFDFSLQIFSHNQQILLKKQLIFNDSSKILSKISPKIQNFGQSDPKNCVFFYSSPALNLRLKVFTKLHDPSCKNTKFSSF